MDGWMDGRTDGWRDGWMDGGRQTDRRIGTRIWGPTDPMHLGRKGRVLCAPLLVSPVISRCTPRQMTSETSTSERWNYG
jgi:hypothetical protein